MHGLSNGEIPYFRHVFASRWDWSPGCFNPIVRLVATDDVANVMIVAPDCRWWLHPYDGGMDVILDSPASRAALRNKYREWLSRNSNGM